MLDQSNLTIFSDGGARGNPGPAASAYVVYKENEVVQKASKYLGETTNNVAEYNGVIIALSWLTQKENSLLYLNDQINFKMDSELVVKQLTGIYKIKDKKLMELSLIIKNIIRENKLQINFIHVPRSENAFADKLVNEKLDDSSRL